MSGRRILIAGISGHWGTALARELERDPTVDFREGFLSLIGPRTRH